MTPKTTTEKSVSDGDEQQSFPDLDGDGAVDDGQPDAEGPDFNDLPPFTQTPPKSEVLHFTVAPDEEPRAPLTPIEEEYAATIRSAQENEEISAPAFDEETGGVIAPKPSRVSDAQVLQGVDIVIAAVDPARVPAEYKSGGHVNQARIREVAMQAFAQHKPPDIPGVMLGTTGLPEDWFMV